MTADDLKRYSAEFVAMLTDATASLTTIQGLEVGFFDRIPSDKLITAQEMSSQMGYDISRVERWLRFAVACGYVRHADGGYTLTPKGELLRHDTPLPDLLGLHNMVSYFTAAIQHSRDVYQKGLGLDSLTKGKISREYIPRVASQLSKAAAAFFHRCGVSMGHTILDLGCGDGSVLRETVKTCPGASATGVDINAHTLELARARNREAGLQDQIDLQPGDITDLSRFQDRSVDWVCSINVFHYLPVKRREAFLREMIRISRYGIFTNQIVTSSLGTFAVDVLLATLFTDFTGFFSAEEADALIEKTGIRHYLFQPIIQGESRLLVLFTSKTDVPISRIPGLADLDRAALNQNKITTSKDILTAPPEVLARCGVDPEQMRRTAVKLLFP